MIVYCWTCTTPGELRIPCGFNASLQFRWSLLLLLQRLRLLMNVLAEVFESVLAKYWYSAM
jgi:hypothetical protein